MDGVALPTSSSTTPSDSHQLQDSNQDAARHDSARRAARHERERRERDATPRVAGTTYAFAPDHSVSSTPPDQGDDRGDDRRGSEESRPRRGSGVSVQSYLSSATGASEGPRTPPERVRDHAPERVRDHAPRTGASEGPRAEDISNPGPPTSGSGMLSLSDEDSIEENACKAATIGQKSPRMGASGVVGGVLPRWDATIRGLGAGLAASGVMSEDEGESEVSGVRRGETNKYTGRSAFGRGRM